PLNPSLHFGVNDTPTLNSDVPSRRPSTYHSVRSVEFRPVRPGRQRNLLPPFRATAPRYATASLMELTEHEEDEIDDSLETLEQKLPSYRDIANPKPLPRLLNYLAIRYLEAD